VTTFDGATVSRAAALGGTFDANAPIAESMTTDDDVVTVTRFDAAAAVRGRTVATIWVAGIRETKTFRPIERERLSDRFIFRPGDLRQMDFGESCFDVIVLGHICHGEGAERTQDLIERGYRALRSGGQILIAEFVPDDDRRGPLMPLLFALHMLVLTDNGDAFTLAEYTKWLVHAGFGDVRTVAAPAPSPLILATKR
jgi:SAM-dependent methyltransferase